MKTLLLLALTTLLSTPVHAAPKTPLHVSAAASLVDALPQAAAAWNRAHPDSPIEASFESSAKLARQIEDGAPADLFISADTEWMAYLEQRHKIDAASRTHLLSNQIVWIVPAKNIKAPESAAQIASFHYRHVALAGENVPISRYARAALEKLGAWTAVAKFVVRGQNVRTSLRWVSHGDADAGVVYRSDATGNTQVKVAFEFPPSSHPQILYPIAVTTSAHDPKTARAFIAYLKSPEARAIFEKAGFTAVQE